MKVRSIELQGVYDAIRNFYPKGLAAPPLPERDDPAYIEYRQTYKHVIKGVPQTNGVYLWYAVRQSRPTEYIYVGESHANKGGLRGRLDDEFRRTYHGFWATVFNSDKYLNETITVFGNRERYKPTKSYAQDIRNDYERRGATHVVFCEGIPNTEDVVALQNDLIQMFGNPRGNIKDKRDSPLPESQLLDRAKLIHQDFLNVAQSSKPFEG